jgi:hypothetical protein
MQPTEAMQHLLSLADRVINLGQARDEEDNLKLSTAVITAMLNTALPIARYRAFVEVSKIYRKTSDLSTVEGEFTICAVDIKALKSGLAALYSADVEVRVVIFEQRADGADMVEGFQGKTRSQNYRVWYRNLGVEAKPN